MKTSKQPKRYRAAATAKSRRLQRVVRKRIVGKLAVEIYKVALRGAGRPVRGRVPWDDCIESVKKSTMAVARWHLKQLSNAGAQRPATGDTR